LWITARTRAWEVNAIFAIAGTFTRCADNNMIWARRQRTTDLDPRRTIDKSFWPASLVNSRTYTLCHDQKPAQPKPSGGGRDLTNVAGHSTSRGCGDPDNVPRPRWCRCEPQRLMAT
jgi:hypothetical protein